MEDKMKLNNNITTHDSEHHGLENLGQSLRKICDSIGFKLAVAGVGVSMLAGCGPASPGFNSRYNNAYTQLPEPPVNARLQIGVTAHGREDSYDILINYIEWNPQNSNFVRRDVHYSARNTTSSWNMYDDHFSEKGGYEQKIIDGEVLASGAIVDQKNGVILLPGGNIMDGPTGKVFAPDGKTVIKVPMR